MGLRKARLQQLRISSIIDVWNLKKNLMKLNRIFDRYEKKAVNQIKCFPLISNDTESRTKADR